MSSDSAGRDELLELAAEIEEYADAPAQLLNIAAKVRRLALSRQSAQGAEAVAWVPRAPCGEFAWEYATPTRPLERYRFPGFPDTPIFVAPPDTVPSVELEQFRKDAERYRFLRDDAFENADDCFMEAGRLFSEKNGKGFDEYIDRAMQEGK